MSHNSRTEKPRTLNLVECRSRDPLSMLTERGQKVKGQGHKAENALMVKLLD